MCLNLEVNTIKAQGNLPMFQLPVVVFFQEMLCYQSRFGQAYATGLDGCGLELEAAVRRAYYTLVRRLVNAAKTHSRLSLPS